MLCVRCGGTGRYMGLGMMPANCELCANPKPVAVRQAPITIDKRSEAYRIAIRDIMAANPKLTRGSAVKLFEQSFNGDNGNTL